MEPQSSQQQNGHVQQPEVLPDPQKPDGFTGVSENMLFAALSYVGVLVLIPLLLRRDDPYVSFHAKQGLVMLIGFAIALLAARWAPVVGNVLFLILLLVDVVALVQALLGRWWKIPLLGQVADMFRI